MKSDKIKLLLWFSVETNGGASQPEGREALKPAGTAADTYVWLARGQRGEQAVAGLPFCILWALYIHLRSPTETDVLSLTAHTS